ncbi:MAG TPA: glycoside hydrolase family 95 protein, partial [Clostridia bacterium]|nr:glycoside hydrolase family 95 protein [Clostridia bacterium]
MKKLILIPVLCLLLGGSVLAAASPGPSLRLWYDRPAQDWMTEALPVGNGSIGAMVFGKTDWERIQFNEISLWTGDEQDTGAYQAFGDLYLKLDHADPADYHRELDITRAVQTVSYRRDGIRFERTIFASHPAQVIAVRLTADRRGSCSGRLWLTDMHEAAIVAEGNRLRSTGQLKNGLDYEAQVMILNQGGKLEVQTEEGIQLPGAKQTLPKVSLRFDRCDSVVILLAAGTSYLPDSTKRWRGEHPHAKVSQRLEAAGKKSFRRLLAEHEKDYSALFGRVALDVGATASDSAQKPTNQRLAAFREGAVDPDLEELIFQYGRYLLISSSRAGGLPANLQGLWNDSNNPPWR